MRQVIYLASGNRHKLEEISGMLAGLPGIELRSAADLGGMPEVIEDAPDFEGNARLKAEALMTRLPPGAWVLADDSGLEVDALDRAPGVHSARYAGNEASYADNNAKLLQALDGVPPGQRRARFVSVFCLLRPECQFFRGECLGSITEDLDGEEGFGYDPLFVPDGYAATFATLGGEIKNRVSHRARAVQELARYLRAQSSST